MPKPSLYDLGSDDTHPGPEPGTALTASVETIDNDVANLMIAAGVVR